MLPNVHLVFYGSDLEMRGLYLDSLDKIDLSVGVPEFKSGHRYLVVYNDNAKDASEQPVNIIRDTGIHYGPRGENHYDYTKCPYLTTKDGIIFKFIYKRYEGQNTWLDQAQYEGMLAHIDQIKTKLRNAELSTGISKKTGKQWYRLYFEKFKEVGSDVRDFCEKESYVKPQRDIKATERIRTADRIEAAFKYFLSKPEGTVFGLDYETCKGYPMESPDFEPVGLGIAVCDDDAIGVYFDLQWMKYEGTVELDVFLSWFNKYLDKFEDSVTYNNSFEQKVTYLLSHRLILFDEGATINKCDGLVYKRLSLKYTVQRVLGIKSWDDQFDLLTGELLPALFGYNEETEEFTWKKVADGENQIESGVDDEGNPIMISVPNDYKHNPVWQEILRLFPDQESEFIKLIERDYGEPFACIPSEIQTQYCCRDAYYTGLLKIDGLSRYSELCYSTYNRNLQLEALLHLDGFFADEDLRKKMELQCLWLEVYGKVNTCRWVLRQLLDIYSMELPWIPNLTPLIKAGYDPCNSKSIIMDHLSDTSESGLDEDAVRKLVGDEVLELYLKYIKEYCFRIDESFKRSRKIFNLLDEALEDYYKPIYEDDKCFFTVNGVQYEIPVDFDTLAYCYNLQGNYELVKNWSEQLNFDEIQKLLLPQLGESHLPDNLTYTHKDGTVDRYSLDEVIDLIDDTIYNYNSPKISPYPKFMCFKKFGGILYRAFITDYEPIPWGTTGELTDELIQQAKDRDYSVEWLDSSAKLLINEDLDRIKQSRAWKEFKLSDDILSLVYRCVYDEAVYDENGKETWGYFQVVPSGEKLPDGSPHYDWSENVQKWVDQMKLELGGGWLDFLFRYIGYWTMSEDDKPRFYKEINNIDIEGNTLESLAKLNYCVMISKKYNKVLTAYMRGEDFYTHNYNVSYFDENGVTPNKYEEKGVHKCYIPFYANAKKSKRWSSGYHTIPSKSEMKRIVTTPPGYLMSYFDISGAEIRTISFMSQDPFMMNCYREGKDPYVTMASYTFLRDQDPYDKMSDEEYTDLLKSWRGAFKSILLGCLYGMGPDKLAEAADISTEEAEMVQADLWRRCPTLKKFIEQKSTWAEEHPGYVQSALGDVLELGDDDGADRLARLGINQFIQNYSSVSLADGFMNVIEKSIHHTDEKLNSEDFILRPLGVVHDSCQIYFKTKYLFEMNEYYTRNLTGYLNDIHKILYAFDLEVGTNYFDVCDLKQLDPVTIELAGTYTALNGLIQKCKDDGLPIKILKVTTNPKHGEPEVIQTDGVNIAEQFKPKLPKSIVEQFLEDNCYARFNLDKSKFKVVIQKV